MSLLINENCITCDACVADCPNDAISATATIHKIDPAACTECVGSHDEPQCVSVCPVDCIVEDPDHRESRDALMAKYQARHG